ncbi:MAG: hypothetical protein DWQ05_05535 [Calditrichaeota bacterium]|nr:MAG: hypothetical protein DWQ05_05535 [Calditrichota bacterium]
MRIFTIFIISAITFISCDKKSTETPPQNSEYNEAIADGWQAFAEKNYSAAKVQFNEAKSIDAALATAYAGIGWIFIMQDSISLADQNFELGSQKTDPDATLFAGWSISLNLRHNFEASITQANEALSLDADWSLGNGTTIDKTTIYVLLASNYFLTGKFSDSLIYVQKVNSGFSTDVYSAFGRAQLSQEIERLSSTGG